MLKKENRTVLQSPIHCILNSIILHNLNLFHPPNHCVQTFYLKFNYNICKVKQKPKQKIPSKQWDERSSRFKGAQLKDAGHPFLFNLRNESV